MTSRQMKRGSSAPRWQSNARQSNYKRGVGRRIDAVCQLMLLQGVFQKVNFFKFFVCKMRLILFWRRVIVLCRCAVGWVMESWGKGSLLMRDLMAYHGDEVAPIIEQSFVLFQFCVSQLPISHARESLSVSLLSPSSYLLALSLL